MNMEKEAKVEKNTLYPKTHYPLDTSQFKGKVFAECLLERVRQNIAEKGDKRWLTNGARHATGTSLVFGEESHNFAEVEPRSRQMARVLHNRFGVQKGDVVHFVMPGNTEMYFPVIGTWLLQGVVSPGDPGLSAEVLSLQLGEARVKIIFCCLATLDKVRQAKKLCGEDIPVIVMDGAGNEGSETSMQFLIKVDKEGSYPEPPLPKIVEENELMMICWSSGTTGRPKGIMHGPKMFFKLFENNALGMKTLQTTCLFHLGGFSSPLKNLIHCTENIFIAGEDLDDNISLILKVVEKCLAGCLACGSHHLIQLASLKLSPGQQPLTSVQLIIPMGTNVYDGIFQDLKDKFPSAFAVLNVYGQSEGGIGVSVGFEQKNLGAIICPAVRIVDPISGEVLGPNTVGEITYQSDAPMLGYLNHPEENKAFFGKDGFLHSGDLGYYDEMEVLYYAGRLKELIKYKNFHLYPNELEELLLSHDAVEDAGVFGKPEASVQELVTALVVKKKDSEVSEKELQEHVDSKVDDHKKLRGGVHFVEMIPRNPQGKVLRKKLLDLPKQN